MINIMVTNRKPRRQTVKFRATKVVKKPTVVSFRTKSGKRVYFSATKVVRQKAEVSFNAKKPKRK